MTRVSPTILLTAALLAPHMAASATGTCTGTYPSYWQDMNPKFIDQWAGQTISNSPPSTWEGPVFQLSDAYPRKPVDDRAAQPWRDPRFDALFASNTPRAEREALAKEYAWLVMDYIQAGNVNQAGREDWDVCENPVRPWYHIPFQTYDPMSGREFTHGLTREAPVTFSVAVGDGVDKSTMWAVAVFNGTAAYTLGQVWQADGSARIPTTDLSFDEGAVVGKPLFNTSTPGQLPVLANMPVWRANISDTAFCGCTPKDPKQAECSMIEESQQCPRSTAAWNPVRLLQFDIAVKDSRAPGTQWVFGTFVADGQRKASEPNPWYRISPLGLMWGNDTPPAGQLAATYPADPRENGFAEAVIFWDTVDELNRYAGPVAAQAMGHLGCNNRLNGPADNANSSCMSCHGTASVPDSQTVTPPLVAQFSSTITPECAAPRRGAADYGQDRAGAIAQRENGVDFAAIDALYFANTPAGTPFNAVANTPSGPVNIMGKNVPDYGHSKRDTWISLDYSMQLSISLQEWMHWQAHRTMAAERRIHDREIRRNVAEPMVQ